MQKIFFLIWLFSGLGIMTEVAAEMPTIIEAEANTKDGGKNIAIVEQPADSGNPLGNPIVGAYVAPKAYNAADGLSVYNHYNEQNDVMGDNQAEESVQNQAVELGHDFENTLIEANGRIYSTQSYPADDIEVIGNKTMPQTIYSPNVNQ